MLYVNSVKTAACLILIFLSVFAESKETKGAFQSTKIGGLFQDYSGATNKSFSAGSPGSGFELSKDSGNTFLRYFFKSRFTYAEGKQNFLDAGTVFNSNYKFVQFAPEIGVSIYPIARKGKDMNVYLWGVAGVSYNNLELKDLSATSTLRKKDQSFGYGYGGGVGFEYIVDSGGSTGSYLLVYGELGFRDERANLVNYNQFEISGMTYSIGIGF